MCAHIDYVTFTARPRDKPRELLELGKEIAGEERRAGNKARHANWRDYSGYRCGRAFFGEREDGVLVRVESDLADRYAPALAAEASNCTRLDLACTWLLDDGTPRAWIADAYYGREAKPRRGRPTEDGLHLSVRGGATLTVGARTSETFGRVYAKGAKSPKDYPWNAIRAEVEVKPRDSTPIRLNLARGIFTPDRIVAEVANWYAERGVDLPFPAAGGGTLLEFPAHRTDLDRTIEWFRSQVAPGFRRCVAAGRLDEALNALGIQPYVTRRAGPTPLKLVG